MTSMSNDSMLLQDRYSNPDQFKRPRLACCENESSPIDAKRTSHPIKRLREYEPECLTPERRRVFSKLSERLCLQEGGCSPKVMKVARLLEHLLFQKNGHDLESYTDESKLDRRLSELMSHMVFRKAAKISAAKKPDRVAILTRIFNQDRGKVDRTFAIAREIKDLRLYRASQGCASGLCSPTRRMQPQDFSVAPALPPRSSVPTPVRNLFFHTRLVAALEQSPADEMEKIDWNQLLLEGEQHLSDYKTWMTIHSSRGLPDPESWSETCDVSIAKPSYTEGSGCFNKPLSSGRKELMELPLIARADETNLEELLLMPAGDKRDDRCLNVKMLRSGGTKSLLTQGRVLVNSAPKPDSAPTGSNESTSTGNC